MGQLLIKKTLVPLYFKQRFFKVKVIILNQNNSTVAISGIPDLIKIDMFNGATDTVFSQFELVGKLLLVFIDRHTCT